MTKLLGASAAIIAMVLIGFFIFGKSNRSDVGEGTQVKEAQTQGAVVKDVSAAQAADLAEKNKENSSFSIIDVRTPSEYASGHLEAAVNINYSSSSFKDEVAKLDKNKVYLIYCHSGNRSVGASEVMKELGFSEVYNLLGGISAWSSGGFPIEK